MEGDERHMLRALELAGRGRGAVEPNPMVGAVIVRDGRVLGEGWHGRFGGPHAEREALAAARQAGHDVRGATVYVTLEPCCHHGKTPPCTDALIEAGAARVLAAMEDPDPRVAGKGLAALRRAGVVAEVGLCAAAARELLAPYVKLRVQGRPWVTCKWAQTADGWLALGEGGPRWITGPAAREHVHRVRAGCDGILVGVGTVLADDPELTNRSGAGRRPTRVVLDSRLRTPLESKLVRSAGETPLLLATTAAAMTAQPARAAELLGRGAELLPLDEGPGGLDLNALLDELGRRQWTHLLVEGGAKVLASFLSGGLADEVLVYVSPRRAGAADLPRTDIAEWRTRLNLREIKRARFGDDEMFRYRMGP
ncbi:MAG TPA: bifunctional diaminohydroxyphosphoribosylaminopyrimidine deaminase/5-amino-6-(5-phosphoribosylamino)uracil reductase RibD [Phycisphaerae bacterium]|nr:bifunctional diaminohydroxyphosphoribosylaminopyrimidine deaminase/5-amino-6-(5-phosphoribosylamino)uracil reductase RibD [Phycisphaerae bacterium]